jgi:Recombinase
MTIPHRASPFIQARRKDTAYTGDLVWNRRTDGRFHQIKNGTAVEREVAHGARLVPNDESDWIVVRDAHEPLVRRRVFEQAKQRRESKPASIEQRGSDPRRKGKKRADGTRVATMSYACGGYITKGTSVCQMNSILQTDIEETVINAVLEFYDPYLAKGGKQKLADAVKNELGSEDDQLTRARWGRPADPPTRRSHRSTARRGSSRIGSERVIRRHWN